MDSQTDAGERVPWPCPSHPGPRCHPPHHPSPPSIPQTAPPQLQPLFTAGCWGREPLHFGDNQGPGRGQGSRARRQSGWCGGRGRGKEGAGELGESVLLQWRRAESRGEGPGVQPHLPVPAVLPVTLGAGGERRTQAVAPGLAQAWLCTDSMLGVPSIVFQGPTPSFPIARILSGFRVKDPGPLAEPALHPSPSNPAGSPRPHWVPTSPSSPTHQLSAAA